MQTANIITQELLNSITQTNSQQALEYTPMCFLVENIKELVPSFEFGSSVETNGWDHDFWLYFTYNNVKFCLSGSWYYGNYKLGISNE